jgi:hypothetical protein
MPTVDMDGCHRCRHFVDDPQQLEDALPGLTILSSAWGSTRGRAGLCACHETWQDPVTGCPDFEPAPAATFRESAACVTKR